MARTIRGAERRRQHRRARWILPFVAAAAGFAGYGASEATGRWHAGVALGAVLFVLALHRLYRTSGRSRSWRTGARGERRTARHLAPLSWAGKGRWAILHDRQVPSSRANLDTIVLGPCGAVYVDTKAWMSQSSKVRMRDGQLWYGRFSQQRSMDTVRWEADRAAAVLNCPVRAVVAVHGAAIPPGGLHVPGNGVTVLQARELRSYLRRLPHEHGWSRRRVQVTRLKANVLLPPAS
ncbi:nuclease-related domain-containing protein [Streptomyces nanshensis]|nr:nuclease-related domain-containing protein [Streptomyces nanshensis]